MAGLLDLGNGIKMVNPSTFAPAPQPQNAVKDGLSILKLRNDLQNAPLQRQRLQQDVQKGGLDIKKGQLDVELKTSQVELAASQAFEQEQKINIEKNKAFTEFYKQGIDLLKDNPLAGQAYIKQVMPDAQISVNETGEVAQVTIPTTKLQKDSNGALQEVKTNESFSFNISKGEINAQQRSQLTGQWFDKFNKNKSIDAYLGRSLHFNQITALAAKKTNVADLGLLVNYMKVIEPTSAVQQGELATVENAPGVSQRVIGLYNGLRGGGTLSDDVRKNLIEASKSMYNSFRDPAIQAGRNIAEIARRQGLNPNNVVQPIADISVDSFLTSDDDLLNSVRGGLK